MNVCRYLLRELWWTKQRGAWLLSCHTDTTGHLYSRVTKDQDKWPQNSTIYWTNFFLKDIKCENFSTWVRVMMFNDTFNNILVISWRSVLWVGETGVPGENYRPVAGHWRTLSHNVVSSTPSNEWDSNSQL